MTLYVVSNGQGVYKTTDGGATWEPKNHGLTSLSIRARLLIDPTDPGTLYVGTTSGAGVFTSHDGGENWEPLSDGLPNQQIYDLSMDPQDSHTIYAATRGSSVFVLHVPPRAVVQSVVINDGSAQRSMVTSLTVTFNTVVTTDPGAFELARQGGGVIDVNVAESIVDGRAVDTLTFAGAGLAGGSLPDGQHRQFALPSAPTTPTPENVERLDQLFAAGREEGTSLVLPRSKRDLLSFSDEVGADADF
jgi:hypothetical protein